MAALPAAAPQNGSVLQSERVLPLGPHTQAQLLALLERQATAVLVAALEAAGHRVEDGWALRGELRLERVGPSGGTANGTP